MESAWRPSGWLKFHWSMGEPAASNHVGTLGVSRVRHVECNSYNEDLTISSTTKRCDLMVWNRFGEGSTPKHWGFCGETNWDVRDLNICLCHLMPHAKATRLRTPKRTIWPISAFRTAPSLSLVEFSDLLTKCPTCHLGVGGVLLDECLPNRMLRIMWAWSLVLWCLKKQKRWFKVTVYDSFTCFILFQHSRHANSGFLLLNFGLQSYHLLHQRSLQAQHRSLKTKVTEVVWCAWNAPLPCQRHYHQLS